MADELTERIIGAAIEVHKALGPGLLRFGTALGRCKEIDSATGGSVILINDE